MTLSHQTKITMNGPIVLMLTSSLHVLVWEEDREELLMLTSVQAMIVWVSGGRPHNLVLTSVEWPVKIITH